MAANPEEKVGDIRIRDGMSYRDALNPKAPETRHFQIDDLAAKAEEIMRSLLSVWLQNNPGKKFKDYLNPLFNTLVEGLEIQDEEMDLCIIRFIQQAQLPSTTLKTKELLLNNIKAISELSDEQCGGLREAFEIDRASGNSIEG